MSSWGWSFCYKIRVIHWENSSQQQSRRFEYRVGPWFASSNSTSAQHLFKVALLHWIPLKNPPIELMFKTCNWSLVKE
jgi:hypothetical protein